MHSETSQSPTTNCYLWQRQAYHPAAPSTRGGGSTGNPNIGIQWRFENDPRDVFPMNFEDKLLWYHLISLDIWTYLNVKTCINPHHILIFEYPSHVFEDICDTCASYGFLPATDQQPSGILRQQNDLFACVHAWVAIWTIWSFVKLSCVDMEVS